MGNHKFDDIAAAFGSSFEPEDEDKEKYLPARSLDDLSSDLKVKQEIMKSDDDLIEDQTYIQTELKIGVELLGDVAETLRSGLNQGSKASQFDSFASIMREKREYLRDLKDTNVKIREMKNPSNLPQLAGGNITQNNLVMTGTDALDMIRSIIDGTVNTKPEETDFEEM